MIALIIVIALWINPIISFSIVYYTKSKTRIRRKLFITSLFISIIVVICIFTNISTISFAVDLFIIAIFHFFVCILLWQSYYHINEIVSACAVLVMVITFARGYFISTAGIIGIIFAVSEFEPIKEISINKSTVYKEYSFGNAVSSKEGIKVSVFTSFYWFPFFEREFFSKQYIGASHIESSDKFISRQDSIVKNNPSFYGNILEMKYNSIKKELIICDNNNKDTLDLK